VITSGNCGTSVGTGVLIVGYSTGTTAGSYWLVQLSWGTSWGVNGYVKIGMASGAGICGINEEVEYPNVIQAI
jgi:hypothetical protein